MFTTICMHLSRASSHQSCVLLPVAAIPPAVFAADFSAVRAEVPPQASSQSFSLPYRGAVPPPLPVQAARTLMAFQAHSHHLIPLRQFEDLMRQPTAII